ncbi:MAG: hypothetical protein JSV17_11650 [Candidatus Aminicenantes bacterium]|nr:MAG: hypothetical protein JSV17_11650 [Candidatus Aminicenantes bacterium]
MTYQERDYEIIDYKMYCDKKTGLWLRGPEPERLEQGRYIACIGGAQTFGCFCDKPFAGLMQESLNIPVVNYGIGGAGPSYFLQHEKVFGLLNKAACTIIQVMSGRSESNSVFNTGGLAYLTRRSDGRRLGARAAYQSLLRRKMIFGRKNLKRIITETRNNWIRNYLFLLEKIDAPIVLFWFAMREPEYREHYIHVSTLLGGFPHLVNREMLETIKKEADDYVHCVTDRGIPQRLISRFTDKPVKVDPGHPRKDLKGRPWSHNFYYPSPEMHKEAAGLLMPACKKYV